jgi:hypothetical protein
MEIVQIVLDKKLLRAADQAARRTNRNRSAPCVMLSASTCDDWQSAIWKNATEPAIANCGRIVARQSRGKRRPYGQRNKPRGRSALSVRST